mmetsp:Transcript_38473/g.99932  ORF Transcript_38473/g.99932 Transcript_38473/m.99932 type:complete len:424 (-) Transcript_38473:205-1476(-)
MYAGQQGMSSWRALLHLDALPGHVLDDGVDRLADAHDLLVPMLQLLGRHVKADDTRHLVDAALHALLQNHLRRHRLRFLGGHAQQRSQLGARDVVVQLAGGRQVVLRDGAVQHRGAVGQQRALVRRQRLRKRLHLRRPQDALQVNLLQEGEDRQPRAALVLVQRGEHAGALRARGREDGARDGRRQRLLEFALVHHLARHPQRLQLAQLVVARGGVQEAALGVQDARVADLVLQLQRLVLAAGHQEVGLLDEHLRVDGVVVLEVEHRDLDVFAQLVRRVRAARAAVEVDARQHLRRLGPVLARLQHLRQLLPDCRHRVLEAHNARLDLLQRVLCHLLVRLCRQGLDARRKQVEHLSPHHQWHVLRQHVVHEALEVLRDTGGDVALQDAPVGGHLGLLVAHRHHRCEVRHTAYFVAPASSELFA